VQCLPLLEPERAVEGMGRLFCGARGEVDAGGTRIARPFDRVVDKRTTDPDPPRLWGNDEMIEVRLKLRSASCRRRA
jgi:hypothetical protein